MKNWLLRVLIEFYKIKGHKQIYDENHHFNFTVSELYITTKSFFHDLYTRHKREEIVLRYDKKSCH